jgi:imidazolonepropionase-like amidohydrolase
MVADWSRKGASSFKAYTHITTAELKASIEESHRRGAKTTGHLCSIGYSEAAEVGIDNIEHGFLLDTEVNPAKAPDVCPQGSSNGLASVDVNGKVLADIIAPC